MEDVYEDAVARTTTICGGLPEIEEIPRDHSVSFRIRGRIVAHVAIVRNRTGEPVPILICRADPEERPFLLAQGRPFFESGNSRNIGIVLSAKTDWDEMAELITESYRQQAPKFLIAKLADQ